MKADGNKVWKKDLRCLFILKNDDGVRKRCGLLFQNDNQLRMHKSQTGHKIERKRTKSTTEQAKSGKQLRIDTTPVNTGVRIIDSCSESDRDVED